MLAVAESVEHFDHAGVGQPGKDLFLDVRLVELAGLSEGDESTLMSCYFVIFLRANSPLGFFTR
jgi:hypothetical protein